MNTQVAAWEAWCAKVEARNGSRLGLLARARKGRRIRAEDTGTARAYCTGVDSRHVYVTGDGFTAWGSSCRCIKDALKEQTKCV